MANEYLDDLQNQAGEIRKPTNPYLDTLQQEQQGGTAALRGNLSRSIDVNPDQYATKKRVASYLGYPTAAVEAQPQLEAQAKIRQIDDGTQSAPVLRGKFTDADFAKLAHDDVGTLSTIEQSLRSAFRPVRALGSGLIGRTAEMASGVPETAVKFLAPLFDPLAGTLLPENPLRRVAAGLERSRKSATALGDTIRGDQTGAGFVEQSINSGFESFGAMLPGLAASVYTGNPQFMLGLGGAGSFSQASTKALDAGKSPMQAIGYGAADATAEIATEMLPVGRLLKDLKAGAPIITMLGRQIAMEVPTEMAATAWQGFNEWATLNSDQPISTYLEKLPEMEAQTIIATITQSVLTAGMGGAVRRIATRSERNQDTAQSAEMNTQVFADLDQLAAASKVRGRDPQSFQQFVEQAAADGPVQDIYIDAKALAQSGVIEQLVEASPAVAAQFEEALATGGDVRIPVGEYATTIAGTDLSQSLLDHLKTDPDGMSRAEAQEFMQSHSDNLQAEIEQVLGEKEAADTFRQSAEVVKANVQGQLDAVARFTAPVNDAYSTLVSNFYAVTAAKMGTTPEELFARYPLKVAAERITGESLDQSPMPAAANGPVSQLWETLAQRDDAFQTGTTTSPDIADAIRDVVPELNGEVRAVEMDGVKGEPRATGFEINIDTKDGASVTAAKVFDVESDRPYIEIGHEQLSLGSGLGKLYQAIAGWALNNGKTLRPDPRGLSEINELRRTEQMIASMLKYGESRMWEPDGTQFVGLLDDNSYGAWRESGKESPSLVAKLDALKAKYWGVVQPNTTDYSVTQARINNMTIASMLLAARRAEGDFKNAIVDSEGNVRVRDEDGSVEVLDEKAGKDAAAASGSMYLGVGYSTRQRALLTAQAVGWTPAQGMAALRRLGTDALQSFDASGRPDRHARAGVQYPGLARLASSEALSGLLYQNKGGNRGAFNPATNTITLLKNADLSTFLHESGHFFLETTFDIAARPDAPAEMRQDADTLLKWFGVESLEEWHALDFEEMRGHHEKFARGFEAYLFEGKSPNVELQGLFQRFRAWLVNIYRDIKSLNVELTDEVRGVMDRMLATTDEIKFAEQSRSMLPLFASPEASGMTPEEFAEYHKLGVDATNDAVQDLQAKGLRDMQWLHNARGREIKKLQRQASELRKVARMDVSREVMSEPIYQAWQFLTSKGEEGAPAGKIAIADVAGDDATWERLRKLKMIAADGIPADTVAEMFGFSSGDQLVKALVEVPLPKDEIEARTDVRMLEDHGELSSDEAIEREADRAIHNDARARFIATETNALAKAVGKPKILADAAREFARQTVARLKLRDIRPSQYANAESRAAKNSAKALKNGDLETAAVEKRNQLVNSYATRAAYDAREEVERSVAYLKKFESAGVRKGLDAEYTDQIDTLLERFDLREQSNVAAERTVSLRTWVQSRLNAGEIPQIAESLLSPRERATYLAEVQTRDEDGELVYADDEDQIKLLAEAIDRSARRPYRDLTVEEFRGLVDTVKQIEHLSRMKHKLLTARDQENYEAVRDDIAAGIAAEAKGSGKNTRTANDWLGKRLQSIKQFGAAHIKVATWARIMDGGKDNGPVWRYIVQPANERATQETTMRAEATAALDAIMRPVLDKVAITDKMGKGKFFPSINDSLNWQERFAIALNVGNESNLQRLLGGKGWTIQQIKPVLDTLTAEEWQAAQAVWDHFESYRPMIAEKELRVSGKEPDWIAARQITVATADGQNLTLRGGYYPVVFDPRVNLKAAQHASAEEAKNLLKASYSAATTRRSFTKTRVDEVQGRPLLLNMQGLYSGVNDVIHDLAWHEWVIDANKLLRSKTIDSAMREHYGPEVKREFEKWRDDIVAGTRRLDHAIERAAGWARQSVSASALTFNVMSAAMQPLGLTNSMSRIGASWVAKGLARYVAGPIDATREAQAKSQWLTNRTRTRFRELNELRNQVQGQTAVKELMGRYGYWMMMRAQMMVDVPTWWGAYEKAIAGGLDEQTAVNVADQSVKDAQGGGEEVDQSGIERGGPLVKLFTAFYGFMGTTLNTTFLSARTEASKAKIAANMALTLMVPAVIGSLLKDALTPGGDDDDEGLVKKLIAEQLSFLMGLVAFGREFSLAAKVITGTAKGQGYSGPTGLRMVPDTLKLLQQTEQGEFDDGFRKSFVNVLGDLTGIPSVQINRSWTGAEALSDGETTNPAALVFGFQKQ